jgi:hypothetical protein
MSVLFAAPAAISAMKRPKFLAGESFSPPTSPMSSRSNSSAVALSLVKGYAALAPKTRIVWLFIGEKGAEEPVPTMSLFQLPSTLTEAFLRVWARKVPP